MREQNQEILRQYELAQRLKVTTNTVRRWTKSCGLPRANLPGAARYIWKDVEEWLRDHGQVRK